MHDHGSIDRLVADIVSGSGLPMERRAEVTEELRDHLSELVEANRRCGQTPELAIKSALTSFGPPGTIRQQLRKQQRRIDRQFAFTKTRRFAGWSFALCAVVATCCALLAPGPAGATSRVLGGAVLFLAFFLAMSVPAYVATLLEHRLTRARPRAEYRFGTSFLRWTAITVGFFAGVLAIGPLLIGIVGYMAQHSLFQSIMYRAPEVVDSAPWRFWSHVSVAMLESPARSLFLPMTVALVSALVISLCERSFCVDETACPAEPTDGDAARPA